MKKEGHAMRFERRFMWFYAVIEIAFGDLSEAERMKLWKAFVREGVASC